MRKRVGLKLVIPSTNLRLRHAVRAERSSGDVQGNGAFNESRAGVLKVVEVGSAGGLGIDTLRRVGSSGGER